LFLKPQIYTNFYDEQTCNVLIPISRDKLCECDEEPIIKKITFGTPIEKS